MSSPNQPPPEQQQGGQLAAILAALVAALIAAETVQTIGALLARLAGMHIEAIRWLLRPRNRGGIREMIEIRPLGTDAWAQAQFIQHRQNLHRRAAYLINAARRASRAYEAGGVDGLNSAIERERRYWEQHLLAQARRTAAASAVANEAQRQGGGLVGWHAVMDERTSRECRQAHGRNFDPNRIPPIGFPGSVHPHCRCSVGQPFATSRRVESIRPDPAAWAA